MAVCVSVGLCFEPKTCGEKQYRSHEESCERSYSRECD